LKERLKVKWLGDKGKLGRLSKASLEIRET
jgi:hypothetical protein